MTLPEKTQNTVKENIFNKGSRPTF